MASSARSPTNFSLWDSKANTGPIVAAGLVLAFAIGIGLMQAFSRPKKVAFKGDFKHYGADRSARERDLDISDEGGSDE